MPGKQRSTVSFSSLGQETGETAIESDHGAQRVKAGTQTEEPGRSKLVPLLCSHRLCGPEELTELCLSPCFLICPKAMRCLHQRVDVRTPRINARKRC